MDAARTASVIAVLLSISTFGMGQSSITADGPLEFCYGESVTLCVEPAYQSYLWCTGSTAQCTTVLESGDYCVLMLDSAGNIDSTFADSGLTVVVHNPEPVTTASGDTLFVTEPFASYQWYHISDSLINGATDSFFVTAGDVGCYWVEVTDSFGCVGRPFIIIDWPPPCFTSVDELETGLFQVHPNPVKDFLQIDFENSASTEMEIIITDAVGRIAHQQIPKQVQNDITIDVSGWPNGIYLVSVSTENSQRHTERVVVQHE